MGYSTRFQGSGGGPSYMAGYSRPTMAQQTPQQGAMPAHPQLPGMPMQAGLTMPPRPAMSTYSTPGALNGMQMGQMPQGQPVMNAQQGMSNPNQLATALSRM